MNEMKRCKVTCNWCGVTMEEGIMLTIEELNARRNKMDMCKQCERDLV